MTHSTTHRCCCLAICRLIFCSERVDAFPEIIFSNFSVLSRTCFHIKRPPAHSILLRSSAGRRRSEQPRELYAPCRSNSPTQWPRPESAASIESQMHPTTTVHGDRRINTQTNSAHVRTRMRSSPRDAPGRAQPRRPPAWRQAGRPPAGTRGGARSRAGTESFPTRLFKWRRAGRALGVGGV